MIPQTLSEVEIENIHDTLDVMYDPSIADAVSSLMARGGHSGLARPCRQRGLNPPAHD
jgi:hypothetical protein